MSAAEDEWAEAEAAAEAAVEAGTDSNPAAPAAPAAAPAAATTQPAKRRRMRLGRGRGGTGGSAASSAASSVPAAAAKRHRPSRSPSPLSQQPAAAAAAARRCDHAGSAALPQGLPLNDAHTDVRGAELKPDHTLRPLWICPDGRIFLERFNVYYEKACDFLAVVAEPVCRPRFIHEYRLTEHSLYAAVAVGLDTESIISVLGKLSKVLLLDSLIMWITDCTMSFGNAKLVLRENCHWVECKSREVMQELLTDEFIKAARDPNPTASAAGPQSAGAANAASGAQAGDRWGGAGIGGAAGGGGGEQAPADEDLDDDALAAMMQEWEEVGGSDYDPRHTQQQHGPNQDGAANAAPSDSAAADGTKQVVENRRRLASETLSKNSAAASVAASAASPSASDKDSSVAGGKDDAEYLEALANGRVDELGDIVAPWEVAAKEGEKVFKFALQSGVAEEVKERCIERQTPLLEEYDFRHDSRNPALKIEAKPSVHLRDYQEKSLKQMFSTGCARSGVIVLPCGAGKTMTGLMAAVTIKKSTLVLCVNTLSVEQWREHFNTHTTVEFKDIHVLTSERRPPHNFLAPGTVDQPASGSVVITTYPMVTYSGRRNEVSDRAMTAIRNTEWGCLILDEVHQVPARTFRRVLSSCKAHCKLGLTATLVREDERISDLHFLIGPKLYEANWLDLAAAGHLARVQCTEMWTPMTSEFYSEYLKADGMGGGGPGQAAAKHMPFRRQLLYSMNPNKVRTCSYLIDFHEAKYDKILVFCDNLYCLKRYATVMKRPYICGSVKQSDRARLLEQFKTSDDVNCLFISRVGDTAIDLPSATVIIQVACTDGSRRQEAQRLGRILRPKDRQTDSSEPNAFFYSLVSRDTDEVFYAAKRQSFLVDQGYSFKVLPAAAALTDAPGLPFETRQSQLQLLSEVLACGEADEIEDEMSFPTTTVASGGASAASAAAASATAAAAANTLAPVRRTGGSLSELSGGAGLVYQEFRPQDREDVREGLQRHVPSGA